MRVFLALQALLALEVIAYSPFPGEPTGSTLPEDETFLGEDVTEDEVGELKRVNPKEMSLRFKVAAIAKLVAESSSDLISGDIKIFADSVSSMTKLKQVLAADSHKLGRMIFLELDKVLGTDDLEEAGMTLNQGEIAKLFPGDPKHEEEDADDASKGKGTHELDVDTGDSDIDCAAEKWASDEVLYVLDPNMDATRKEVAQAAVNEVAAQIGACLKFTKLDSLPAHKNVIYFTSSASGCSHSCTAGSNSGATRIKMGWCNSPQHKGNIVHELGHALGMGHEHKRPDRDTYVNINWNNMVDSNGKDWTSQYTKDNSYEQNRPYNANSIMHYGSNSRISGKTNEITAKMGRRDGGCAGRLVLVAGLCC